MDLTEIQIAILTALADAPNHGMNKAQLNELGETFENFSQEFQALLNQDLVEYEEKEGIYYLAPESFEILESNNTLSKTLSTDEKVDLLLVAFGGPKRIRQFTWLGLLTLSIFFTIFLWFMGKSVNDKDSVPHIEPGVLADLEVQLSHMLDSMAQGQEIKPKTRILELDNQFPDSVVKMPCEYYEIEVVNLIADSVILYFDEFGFLACGRLDINCREPEKSETQINEKTIDSSTVLYLGDSALFDFQVPLYHVNCQNPELRWYSSCMIFTNSQTYNRSLVVNNKSKKAFVHL